MAKHLNLSIGVQADTSAAEANLRNLQQSLNTIASSNIGTSMSKSLNEAAESAQRLQGHLTNAFNVKTGNLDLNKLQSSLKASGDSLSGLSSGLLKAGVNGEKAFLQMHTAIQNANISLSKSKGLLGEFVTTLKNTARWQLSSSVMHGMMGALQSAVNYAEKLDKSLNNIRIVTGKGVDEMKDFAVEANKAAKALSASTTAYTDAALIYYQQGLEGDAVKERADVTIKMAQVAGESATEVSSYMTAIWNNFADGSKELEYYGDVMARLGAETAASSAEIAEGLEKFASIGETVGLSYEYATAAVATVVDKTRQSADTVGTAFKTIFARLQGLSLGETLEDGVNLNKYSEALQAVGVSVLDLNGDLRQANDIIFDLGKKWQTLSNAQQTALAQTVAGTRQYTQLMALMNNFDSFLGNVDIAENAEGTLQRQSNIYAESWEAASKRAKASLEGLYDELIPEDLIIKLTDGFATFVDSVDLVVESMGGLKGIILLLSSIMVNKFQANIAQSINSGIQKVKEFKLGWEGAGNAIRQAKDAVSLTMGKRSTVGSRVEKRDSASRADAQTHRAEVGQVAGNPMGQDISKSLSDAANSSEPMTAGFKTQVKSMKEIDTLNNQILQNSKNLTAEEKQQLSLEMQKLSALVEAKAAAADELEILQQQSAELQTQNIEELFGSSKFDADAGVLATDVKAGGKAQEDFGSQIAALTEKIGLEKESVQLIADEGGLIRVNAQDEANMIALREGALDTLREQVVVDSQITSVLNDQSMTLKEKEDIILGLIDKAEKEGRITEEVAGSYRNAAKGMSTSAKGAKSLETALTKMGAKTKTFVKQLGVSEKTIEGTVKTAVKLEKAQQKNNQASKAYNNQWNTVTNTLTKGLSRVTSIGGALAGAVSGVTSLATTINTVSNAISTISDPDVSWTQKLLSGAMAAGMAINSVVSITQQLSGVMTALNTVASMNNVISASSLVLSGQKNAADVQEIINGQLQSVMLKMKNGELTEEAAKKTLLQGLQAAGIAQDKAEALSQLLVAGSSKLVSEMTEEEIKTTTADTVAKGAGTAANIAYAISMYAITPPVLIVIAVLAILLVAIIAIVSAINAQKAAEEAANKETLKTAQANQEAIDSTQELATSVKDLTEAYNKLKSAGESTTDVLAQMDEQVPELISSYRDLAKTLGGDVKNELMGMADELETLYNYGRITGDLSGFESKQEEIDTYITQQEYNNAKVGGRAGGKLAADAMVDKAGGSVSGSKMTLHVEGSDSVFSSDKEETIARDALAKTMGSYYTKKSDAWLFDDTAAELSVDYTDPAKFADYYEKLQEAQSVMLSTMNETQLANSGIYQQVTDALASGAEYYEQIKPLADAQIEAGGKLAEAALLQQNADYASIDSLKEYTQYREDYIALAQKEYGLTKEQAEAYVDQNSKLSALNGEYKLANTMLDKFFNTDLDSLGKNKDEIMGYFDELTNGLSEEDMQIALGVVMNSESIEEFEQQMRHVTAQATTRAYEQMSTGLQEMMKTARDEGGFSQADMNSLGSNEDFTQFLGEQGMDGGMADFQNMNFDEQYALIAEFYGKVQELRHESVEDQTELYYADLAALQTQHDAMLGLEREYAEAKQAVDEGIASEEQQATIEKYDQMTKAKEDYLAKQKELSKEGITEEQKAAIEDELRGMRNDFKDAFGFDIDLNTTDARSKMDDLLDQVKALNEQQIKIAIEWDGIEEIEGAFANVSDFASMMQKDAKKVGNSYQLTAAQAREWAEVYPDLFAQAKVGTNGIIELDQAAVDNYLEGQNAEVDATVDAKIAELEAEKASMQAKLELVNADLEACYNNLKGKEELENVSAEYLAEQRKNLTQYYMDLGMDEVNADKAALETMGLNEEEYTELVADAATINANNQIDASEEGGKAQTSALSKLAEKWKKFTSVLKQVGAAVKAALTGGDVTEAWNSVGDDFSIDDAKFEGKDLSGYSFEDLEESEITAARDSVNSGLAATFEANKAEIEKAINSIDSQILYLQALKEQDISDFGSTDIDDVKDGKGDGKGDKGNEKTVEDLLDIADNYHYITRQIEMMNRQLDETSKKKDRAFGKDKLKLMKQEQAQLEALYKKQSDLFLLQTARKEAAAIKINDNFKTDAVLDADGNIANYKALENEAINAFNQAKKNWNSSDQGDAAKKAFEEAEKQYEKQMDLLEAYEETLDEWHDQKEEMQELANQIYDAKLEELDYKVQMQIEIADDDLALLEYLLERIENKAFSAADAIANLGNQTQKYFNKNNAYENGMKEIFGNHGLSEEDYNKWINGDQGIAEKLGNLSLTEDEVAKLREYRDGLMETNRALIETRQAVHDKLIATFEEQNEKLDEGIAKLEHYKAVTESYKNIVDLVGKANFKDSDKAIKALNSSMVTQSANIAKANIAKRDKDKAELEATRKAFEQQKNKISEDERKMWEDTIKQMEASLQESEEAAMGSIETWMEAVNDKFIAEIEATMDRFAETVAGKFKNLNELQEAFERRQSENDRYLEDYKKIYEFSKLNRDIEKSIDQTDNVRAKKELLKLQEEINELEESGAEVSEYQMENLRKRYELKLAELALEEAQNAKSQVRMSVDNEGNWGYVYTADASQVAAAEQSYEDKLFELQEQNAEYINTLQENIIQMQIEMKDKLAEIANDESLSIEERQAKMEEVQAYYKGQMDYYASEMNLVCDNNKKLYTEDWTAYSERTDYKISEDERYVDSFEETDLAILTGFENMAGYQQAFNDASDQMLSESNMAFNTWEEEMDAALDAAGLDFEDLSNDMQDKLEEIEGKSNETAETIKNDAEQMVEDYQTVVDAVIEWENQYSTSVENMLTMTEELITKFNEVLTLWAEVQAAAAAPTPTPPPTSDSGDSTDGDGGAAPDSGGSGSGNDGMPPDNSSKAEGVAAAIWMDGGATSGWYNGSDRRSRLSEKGVTAAQSYINAHGPNGDIYRSWASRRGQLKSYYYGAFDTGGYTGEWGPDGKFAMLHEKELVLNKSDTSNILSAVDMIRTISNTIDLNAMSASQGLTSLLGAGRIGEHKESLEQNVTIHAEFPGVSDRNEIQEAFNNLINAASQYANRKI